MLDGSPLLSHFYFQYMEFDQTTVTSELAYQLTPPPLLLGRLPTSSRVMDVEEQSSRVGTKGHWKEAEDAKLKFLVAQHGPQNWSLIAEQLEGRSGIYIYIGFFFFLYVHLLGS